MTVVHRMAEIVASVFSLALLLALIAGVRYVSKIEHIAKASLETLKAISTKLEKQDERLQETEQRVAILWDGRERRRPYTMESTRD